MPLSTVTMMSLVIPEIVPWNWADRLASLSYQQDLVDLILSRALNTYDIHHQSRDYDIDNQTGSKPRLDVIIELQ
jgi:hypothetical protein